LNTTRGAAARHISNTASTTALRPTPASADDDPTRPARNHQLDLSFGSAVDAPFPLFIGTYEELIRQSRCPLRGKGWVSAKNAILIVEFAKDLHEKGATAALAAMEAVRLRLRPIVMTSLAFMLGVLPLAISHGAGSGGQRALGTAVLGGTLSATVLSVFFVPAFFVAVQWVFGRKPKGTQGQTPVKKVAAIR